MTTNVKKCGCVEQSTPLYIATRIKTCVNNLYANKDVSKAMSLKYYKSWYII